MEMAKCVICGAEFKVLRNKICCSPACAKKRKKQITVAQYKQKHQGVNLGKETVGVIWREFLNRPKVKDLIEFSKWRRENVDIT